MVKTNNGVVIKYPYSIVEFRRDNIDKSFPKVITEEILNRFGVYTDVVADKPSFDPALQVAKLAEKPVLINNTWTRTWTVVNKTVYELEEERIASIPKVVTMRQARLALLQSGLLNSVENAINNSTDEQLKIEWEYATELRRDWSSLIALTSQLGLTSAHLDELFILASKI